MITYTFLRFSTITSFFLEVQLFFIQKPRVTRSLRNFIFFLCISFNCAGQIGDLGRVDYTILPSHNSEFEYKGVRILLNYPVKIKEKTYLFIGAGYANVDLVFGDNPLPFDKNAINGFQIFDFNFGYTFELKNNWRFAAKLSPGFSSNLAATGLTFDDAVLSADIVFIKDRKESAALEKPYRLIFGISYSENRGFPYPIPFISYYRKFQPKWSYNLGVPRTNLQYHLSKKHRFKLNVELDGFTANIQNGIALTNNARAESINMSLILASLQYEFHFFNHLECFLRTSYILDKNVQLRDGKRDNIFLLDNTRGTYFRAGVRFKI